MLFTYELLRTLLSAEAVIKGSGLRDNSDLSVYCLKLCFKFVELVVLVLLLWGCCGTWSGNQKLGEDSRMGTYEGRVSSALLLLELGGAAGRCFR